jgi:hypothetical protein
VIDLQKQGRKGTEPHRVAARESFVLKRNVLAEKFIKSHHIAS